MTSQPRPGPALLTTPLTPGSDGVKIFHDELLDSTVNIICVVHHGGGMFYNHLKKSLQTLVQRGQITLLVLGHHVRESVFKDLQLWADNEDAEYWEKTKLETFVPVSNLTHKPWCRSTNT